MLAFSLCHLLSRRRPPPPPPPLPVPVFFRLPASDGALTLAERIARNGYPAPDKAILAPRRHGEKDPPPPVPYGPLLIAPVWFGRPVSQKELAWFVSVPGRRFATAYEMLDLDFFYGGPHGNWLAHGSIFDIGAMWWILRSCNTGYRQRTLDLADVPFGPLWREWHRHLIVFDDPAPILSGEIPTAL